MVEAPATIASICSCRTFDGPQPNRPSAGRSRSGIRIDVASTPPAWQRERTIALCVTDLAVDSQIGDTERGEFCHDGTP